MSGRARDDWDEDKIIRDRSTYPEADKGPLVEIEMDRGISIKITRKTAMEMGLLSEGDVGKKARKQAPNKRRSGSQNK